MTRDALSRAQRDLYLASRAAGDLNAARRGRLPQRLARRTWHRTLIRALTKGGIWR